VKDNMTLNPIFGMLTSRAIQKNTRHARLSLMVKKLDAIKIHEIAEAGNTGWSHGNNEKHAKLFGDLNG